ncbi:hypothetical protein AX16_007371, partial [Volvariella volvacea WC 439]
MNTVPKNFLQECKLDLLAAVIQDRELVFAFCDSEQGTFSSKYYEDYVLLVVLHKPWLESPVVVACAIRDLTRQKTEQQLEAGKFEVSVAFYCSQIFPVVKKDSLIRLIQDVQELNSALLSQIDEFAENFAGRVIYSLGDLFAGYNGRRLAEESRPLITCHSLIGPIHSTDLPQGATNSMPEFQRCTMHLLREKIPNNGDVFVDDVGMMGLLTTYNDEELAPGICHFVYEYATVLDRFLAWFIEVEVTLSGWKMVLATPKLEIVR